MTNGADYDQRISTAMADLAENVPTSVQDALAGVTAAAVDLIEGIEYADVLLIDDGHFQSVSPTAPVVSELDVVQQRLQEGPCLAAAVTESVIRCHDLRDDSRWPQFASAATTMGIYSMLSFQLYTHQRGAGALNLLSTTPRTFTLEAEALGAMLATHAAIALRVDNVQHQFQSALASRDTIGQAKGIIMERFKVDAVQAFEMLKKLSQETNTPLRELATRVITTSLP